MDNGNVYNETTEPQAKPSRCFGCTLQHLWGWRLPAKALQAILSLLAVICEEMVENCVNCGGLYFFEFISCAAFLLSLLILCVYCTNAYEVFGKDKVGNVNIWLVSAIGVCFLIAATALSVTSSDSAAGKAACVFGFLASTVFLAESITDYFDCRKQHVDGHSADPAHTPGATENQPLNQQS